MESLSQSQSSTNGGITTWLFVLNMKENIYSYLISSKDTEVYNSYIESKEYTLFQDHSILIQNHCHWILTIENSVWNNMKKHVLPRKTMEEKTNQKNQIEQILAQFKIYLHNHHPAGAIACAIQIMAIDPMVLILYLLQYSITNSFPHPRYLISIVWFWLAERQNISDIILTNKVCQTVLIQWIDSLACCTKYENFKKALPIGKLEDLVSNHLQQSSEISINRLWTDRKNSNVSSSTNTNKNNIITQFISHYSFSMEFSFVACLSILSILWIFPDHIVELSSSSTIRTTKKMKIDHVSTTSDDDYSSIGEDPIEPIHEFNSDSDLDEHMDIDHNIATSTTTSSSNSTSTTTSTTTDNSKPTAIQELYYSVLDISNVTSEIKVYREMFRRCSLTYLVRFLQSSANFMANQHMNNLETLYTFILHKSQSIQPLWGHANNFKILMDKIDYSSVGLQHNSSLWTPQLPIMLSPRVSHQQSRGWANLLLDRTLFKSFLSWYSWCSLHGGSKKKNEETNQCFDISRYGDLIYTPMVLKSGLHECLKTNTSTASNNTLLLSKKNNYEMYKRSEDDIILPLGDIESITFLDFFKQHMQGILSNSKFEYHWPLTAIENIKGTSSQRDNEINIIKTAKHTWKPLNLYNAKDEIVSIPPEFIRNIDVGYQTESIFCHDTKTLSSNDMKSTKEIYHVITEHMNSIHSIAPVVMNIFKIPWTSFMKKFNTYMDKNKHNLFQISNCLSYLHTVLKKKGNWISQAQKEEDIQLFYNRCKDIEQKNNETVTTDPIETASIPSHFVYIFYSKQSIWFQFSDKSTIEITIPIFSQLNQSYQQYNTNAEFCFPWLRLGIGSGLMTMSNNINNSITSDELDNILQQHFLFKTIESPWLRSIILWSIICIYGNTNTVLKDQLIHDFTNSQTVSNMSSNVYYSNKSLSNVIDPTITQLDGRIRRHIKKDSIDSICYYYYIENNLIKTSKTNYSMYQLPMPNKVTIPSLLSGSIHTNMNKRNQSIGDASVITTNSSTNTNNTIVKSNGGFRNIIGVSTPNSSISTETKTAPTPPPGGPINVNNAKLSAEQIIKQHQQQQHLQQQQPLYSITRWMCFSNDHIRWTSTILFKLLIKYPQALYMLQKSFMNGAFHLLLKTDHLQENKSLPVKLSCHFDTMFPYGNLLISLLIRLKWFELNTTYLYSSDKNQIKDKTTSIFTNINTANHDNLEMNVTTSIVSEEPNNSISLYSRLLYHKQLRSIHIFELWGLFNQEFFAQVLDVNTMPLRNSIIMIDNDKNERMERYLLCLKELQKDGLHLFIAEACSFLLTTLESIYYDPDANNTVHYVLNSWSLYSLTNKADDNNLNLITNRIMLHLCCLLSTSFSEFFPFVKDDILYWRYIHIPSNNNNTSNIVLSGAISILHDLLFENWHSNYIVSSSSSISSLSSSGIEDKEVLQSLLLYRSEDYWKPYITSTSTTSNYTIPTAVHQLLQYIQCDIDSYTKWDTFFNLICQIKNVDTNQQFFYSQLQILYKSNTSASTFRKNIAILLLHEVILYVTIQLQEWWPNTQSYVIPHVWNYLSNSNTTTTMWLTNHPYDFQCQWIVLGTICQFDQQMSRLISQPRITLVLEYSEIILNTLMPIISSHVIFKPLKIYVHLYKYGTSAASLFFKNSHDQKFMPVAIPFTVQDMQSCDLILVSFEQYKKDIIDLYGSETLEKTFYWNEMKSISSLSIWQKLNVYRLSIGSDIFHDAFIFNKKTSYNSKHELKTYLIQRTHTIIHIKPERVPPEYKTAINYKTLCLDLKSTHSVEHLLCHAIPMNSSGWNTYVKPLTIVRYNASTTTTQNESQDRSAFTLSQFLPYWFPPSIMKTSWYTTKDPYCNIHAWYEKQIREKLDRTDESDALFQELCEFVYECNVIHDLDREWKFHIWFNRLWKNKSTHKYLRRWIQSGLVTLDSDRFFQWYNQCTHYYIGYHDYNKIKKPKTNGSSGSKRRRTGIDLLEQDSDIEMETDNNNNNNDNNNNNNNMLDDEEIKCRTAPMITKEIIQQLKEQWNGSIHGELFTPVILEENGTLNIKEESKKMNKRGRPSQNRNSNSNSNINQNQNQNHKMDNNNANNNNVTAESTPVIPSTALSAPSSNSILNYPTYCMPDKKSYSGLDLKKIALWFTHLWFNEDNHTKVQANPFLLSIRNHTMPDLQQKVKKSDSSCSYKELLKQQYMDNCSLDERGVWWLYFKPGPELIHMLYMFSSKKQFPEDKYVFLEMHKAMKRNPIPKQIHSTYYSESFWNQNVRCLPNGEENVLIVCPTVERQTQLLKRLSRALRSQNQVITSSTSILTNQVLIVNIMNKVEDNNMFYYVNTCLPDTHTVSTPILLSVLEIQDKMTSLWNEYSQTYPQKIIVTTQHNIQWLIHCLKDIQHIYFDSTTNITEDNCSYMKPFHSYLATNKYTYVYTLQPQEEEEEEEEEDEEQTLEQKTNHIESDPE